MIQKPYGDITEFISEFLQERGIDLATSCFSNTSFLNSGLIDSYAQIHLLMLLKERFDVEITPEDILQKKGITFEELIEIVGGRSER